ncbi:SAM-dependent DNA methyltransferase [Anaerolineae bacterium CFX9]|nr:SAM-dependent DNA methyltransferase [Anaerolineae bacterium CFX9]
MNPLPLLEDRRLELQTALDARKSKGERNRLGQFATPPMLATRIMEWTKPLLPANEAIRFLEPALGMGAFYSALLQVFPFERISYACGYEIDPHYGEQAQFLWQDYPIDIQVRDFTRISAPASEEERYNLIVCNPPYVRHHHINAVDKLRLQAQSAQATHLKLSGLSGLYVYFLCIAHEWLQTDGLGVWLIPSEFMDVNYGSTIRHYLTSQVTLLNIHRFEPEDMQFDDALVSSAVIWFRKSVPRSDHQICFSLGGTFEKPRFQQSVNVAELRREGKWTRFPKQQTRMRTHNAVQLKDLFDIKRGIATGANQFFIVSKSEIDTYNLPARFLIPILPSPRYLSSDEIQSDEMGNPLLAAPSFLINCPLPEDQVAEQYPDLWRYLQIGRAQGIHERYLCQHRPVWYAQDKRAPSPFLCTYMGRPSDKRANNPFRFILNHSRAVAPNVYLNLYPKRELAQHISKTKDLKRRIWLALKSIPPETLTGEGRVYGGGLYKLEPKELGALFITDIFGDDILTDLIVPNQIRLF